MKEIYGSTADSMIQKDPIQKMLANISWAQSELVAFSGFFIQISIKILVKMSVNISIQIIQITQIS